MGDFFTPTPGETGPDRFRWLRRQSQLALWQLAILAAVMVVLAFAIGRGTAPEPRVFEGPRPTQSGAQAIGSPSVSPAATTSPSATTAAPGAGSSPSTSNSTSTATSTANQSASPSAASTSPPTSASGEPQTFQGSGSQTTQPFTVTGPWEIRWEAGGNRFKITVYKDDLPTVVAADSTGPGSGTSAQPQGGTYALKIEADGQWFIYVDETS